MMTLTVREMAMADERGGPHAGQDTSPEPLAACNGLPGEPAAVADTLGRPRRRPWREPLSPLQRRVLRRLIGWLAGRFEHAAAQTRDPEGPYRTYARLLRRIEGDMVVREGAHPGRRSSPGRAAEVAAAAPSAGQARAAARPADPPPVTGRRRGHLTIVD